jgi:hypothetical protein
MPTLFFLRWDRRVAGGIQVLYAGDLALGRIVLAAGRIASGGAITAWGYAPDTSSPLTWWGSQDYAPEETFRFIDAVGLPDGRVLMAVIGPPAMTAQVSWRPSYPPDGTVARTYAPLPLANGATVEDIDPNSWRLVRVRVAGEEPRYLGQTGWGGTQELDWSPSPAVLAAEHGSADPDLVRDVVTGLAMGLGLPSVDDLTPRVIWGGEVSGQHAVLIHARLRTGRDFRVLSQNEGPLTWVLPRDAPDLPMAWIGEVYEGSVDSEAVVQVLAGKQRLRAELRQLDIVLDAIAVAPYSAERFTRSAPLNDSVELVLRDPSGTVVWAKTLDKLRFPSYID